MLDVFTDVQRHRSSQTVTNTDVLTIVTGEEMFPLLLPVLLAACLMFSSDSPLGSHRPVLTITALGKFVRKKITEPSVRLRFFAKNYEKNVEIYIFLGINKINWLNSVAKWLGFVP